MRDVLFDKRQFYDPKLLNLGHIKEIEEVIETLSLSKSVINT